jgi:hypothetical protein
VFERDDDVPLLPSGIDVAVRLDHLFEPIATIDDRSEFSLLGQLGEEPQVSGRTAAGPATILLPLVIDTQGARSMSGNPPRTRRRRPLAFNDPVLRENGAVPAVSTMTSYGRGLVVAQIGGLSATAPSSGMHLNSA